MAHPNHQIARNFFDAFFRGELTEDLVTSDFTAWTTVGPLPGDVYRGTVTQVINLFKGGKGSFDYTIDAITAEDDRAVLEIRSKGTFTDGEPYENAYVFVLRIRDGRVYAIAEHFNPLPVIEKMVPRLPQLPMGQTA